MFPLCSRYVTQSALSIAPQASVGVYFLRTQGFGTSKALLASVQQIPKARIVAKNQTSAGLRLP